MERDSAGSRRWIARILCESLDELTELILLVPVILLLGPECRSFPTTSVSEHGSLSFASVIGILV